MHNTVYTTFRAAGTARGRGEDGWDSGLTRSLNGQFHRPKKHLSHFTTRTAALMSSSELTIFKTGFPGQNRWYWNFLSLNIIWTVFDSDPRDIVTREMRVNPIPDPAPTLWPVVRRVLDSLHCAVLLVAVPASFCWPCVTKGFISCLPGSGGPRSTVGKVIRTETLLG